MSHWSFLTSEFVYYWMATTTSVLASSWHITYRMSYADSNFLRCHNYYINLDVCCHFISNICCPLYRGSGMISVLTSFRLLFPCITMSSYKFFLPIFLYFVSTLYSITYFMELTLSMFPTFSTSMEIV